ncbi:MAG: redoxin domain-containing protein, partial [Planctomycetes bacterium]|nr:redoxin domain-containing protein [Planctomycetota bacterium]
MNRWSLAVLAAVLLLGGGTPAQETAPKKAELGKPAPDFTLKDLLEKDVSLTKSKGKIVVLEWFNPACPSVETAHGPKGLLRKLPDRHISKNKVVWLAINSTAPDKDGAGLKTNRKYAKKYAMRYPVLLDEDGKVGR